MTIFVDDQPCLLPATPNLAELLHHYAPAAPFAVAVNGEFVPASDFHSIVLSQGDTIEIVHPSAGG